MITYSDETTDKTATVNALVENNTETLETSFDQIALSSRKIIITAGNGVRVCKVKAYVDDMTNLQKLYALANYINNTTHYPGAGCTKKDINPTFYNDFSVDGIGLFYYLFPMPTLNRVMDLQGGKPYNYMLEHFFPELRNSVSTVLYLHIVTQDSETEPEPIAVVPSEEERAPQQEPVRVPADAASMPCETTISATVPAKPRRSYPANMIGVHAGYCISWITSYGLTSSTRPGYEVGVSDRIRLGRQFPFYLRTGLTFISKGYEVRGFDDSVERPILAYNFILIWQRNDFRLNTDKTNRFTLTRFTLRD